MLNWYLRYEPVIEVLDELGAERVLDVGAGWHGLSRWWPQEVVQTDLIYEGDPPREHRVGSVKYVSASAEALPFTDNAFDVAVSLDMMEHLPEEIRAPSLLELARVSRRGFIVGYPLGQAARDLDTRLDHWYSRRGEPRPLWLEEHLAQERYPDEATLTDALPSGWSVARRIESGNGRLQVAVVFAEGYRVGRVVSRLIERVAGRLPRLAAAINRGTAAHRGMWLVMPESTGTRPTPS